MRQFEQYNQMGAGNDRLSQIWLKIEISSKGGERELFDFTKQRILKSQNKAFFPFYIHYYQRTNDLEYSLMQDHQNSICMVDSQDIQHQSLRIVKSPVNRSVKMWKIIEEVDSQELTQGDIIKLGRVELEIKQLKFIVSKKSLRELKTETQQETQQQSLQIQISRSYASQMKNSSMYSKFEHSPSRNILKESDVLSAFQSGDALLNSRFTGKSFNQKICRICFDGFSSKSNPLLNLCQCSGSVKFMHYQCLQSWIKSKMGRVQTVHCLYYHYQPLQCEICKTSLASEVYFEGKKYNLFEPEHIHPPYARLEHFSENKIFQILIRLEESESIIIGRGQQNDLNLNDSSISRSHASLFYTSRKLFLKGHPSKYGTFIQLSRNLQLKEDKQLKLLVSNNLFSIGRQEKDRGFLTEGCCVVQNKIQVVVE